MAAIRTFCGKELEDPEKHVKQFKLNVFSKKLPANAAENLNFAETLSNAASEWFDSLDITTYATINQLYVDFQTRFAFNVTDQWKKTQVFRQKKKRPSELSTDFIRRVEAEGVRIKATAADVRDTILQGLLPAMLNSVMQHELGA